MNTSFAKTQQLLTQFRKMNAKVMDSISYAWSYAILKLQNFYSIAKVTAIKLAQIMRIYYCNYPYQMIGIGTCAVALMGYSIIRKIFHKTPHQKQLKQKPAFTDEQSTYQSLESGHKSQDSFMSLKLPMDAIMELDNEDDAEDRIFFEVYKNYRHT